MRRRLVLMRRRVLATIWRTANPALMTSRGADDDLSFTVGHEEIDIRHRWETASIVITLGRNIHVGRVRRQDA